MDKNTKMDKDTRIVESKLQFNLSLMTRQAQEKF